MEDKRDRFKCEVSSFKTSSIQKIEVYKNVITIYLRLDRNFSCFANSFYINKDRHNKEYLPLDGRKSTEPFHKEVHGSDFEQNKHFHNKNFTLEQSELHHHYLHQSNTVSTEDLLHL